MRPKGTSRELEARRQQAIAMLRRGQAFRAVAVRVGASLSSLVRWWQAYRRDGRRGLRSRPVPGRPSQLSAEQREQLRGLLLQGAVAAGYSTEVWTLKRIGRLIEERFGVRYHPGHIWKLLRHELDWSWQKPQRRAAERDEEAIAKWKRYTWPHIKKGSRTWGPSRVSR